METVIDIGDLAGKTFGEVMDILLPTLASGQSIGFFIWGPDATLEMCLHVVQVLPPRVSH
jgi:hypothetical protein